MNSLKSVALVTLAAAAAIGLGGDHAALSRKLDATQPGGRLVECRWLAGQIVFDGVTDEFAWKKADVMQFTVPWETRKPKSATSARLLWDEDYLYFSADMEDNDLYADVHVQNGRIWNNDSFGLYFKPSEQKLGLYQFEINPCNSQLQVFLPSRGAGGHERFLGKTQVIIESIPKLQGTLNDWTDADKGWAIEGRIPWAAFAPTGGRPKPGERWRFALCRRDYSVTLEQPELATSAPLTAPDMYRYEEYLDLIFLPRN